MASKLEECPLPEDIVDEPASDEEDAAELLQESEEEQKGEEGAEIKLEESKVGEEEVKVSEGAKRKHDKLEQRAEERRLRRMRRSKVEAYYSGSFYGKSVAYIMYSISQQLSKDNAELMWCMIIGITYQYTYSKISKLQYDDAVMELQREVLRVSRQKDSQKMVNEVVDNAEDHKRIESSNLQVGSIITSREYDLFFKRYIDFDSCFSAIGLFLTALITRITLLRSSLFGRSRASDNFINFLLKSAFPWKRPSSSTSI